MSHSMLRYSALLLGLGVLGLGSAHAVVQCESPAMTNLTFGNIDPQSSQTDVTATFSIICENTLLLQTRAATICLSIGPPPTGQQRKMLSGSDALNFELYKDPAHSNIWGSQFSGSITPLKFDVALGPRESKTFSATLYGRVLAGQASVIPGAYTKSYPSTNDARATVNAPVSSSAPGTCNTSPGGSLYFPFTVSATVPKNCIISAASDINLGSKPANAPAATLIGNNNNGLSITCTKSTPYFIGLRPSNNSTTGAGVMSGSGTNITTKVPYQLRQVAGLGTIWGNTATSTNAGNGVGGTGTGLADTRTIYVTVPSADFKPDNYSDKVTVNVNY